MQDAETSRLSYAFEQWLFHYMGRDGIAYLAVADADAGRRIPFAFLAQLESSFQQMGGSDGTGVSCRPTSLHSQPLWIN